MAKTGYWNYRVIEFVDPDGTPWCAIHAVHYDKDGRPAGYAEEPAAVTSDVTADMSGLVWTLDRMREALASPVLVEHNFQRAEEVK